MLNTRKIVAIGLVVLLILIFLFVKHIYPQSNKPNVFYTEIIKIYFASKSKIKILVHSKSYVDENSDLGYGNATVKLFVVNQKKDTVYLKTSQENIDFIKYKNKKIKFECSQMQKNKLYDYLIMIGFKNVNRNEIAELRDAMTLINYGPKATFLKGQTKFIVVKK
jgi:hypothetical protein